MFKNINWKNIDTIAVVGVILIVTAPLWLPMVSGLVSKIPVIGPKLTGTAAPAGLRGARLDTVQLADDFYGMRTGENQCFNGVSPVFTVVDRFKKIIPDFGIYSA